MVQRLRFGTITLPNVDLPTLVQRWQHLEELGFDSIWNIDHFVNPYAITQPWFDGWTLLAVLATQTKSVRIGVLVTSSTYRNPSLLTKQALTLDHVSQGRLELGIGAGGQRTDYSMTGVPFISNPLDRMQRFREMVEIVNKLFDNSKILHREDMRGVNYSGTHFNIKNAINRLSSYQERIPITLAAHVDDSLKLVARYAGTWVSYGGRDLSPMQTYMVTKSRIVKLKMYCEEYGRDPQLIRKAFLVGFTKDEPFASEDAFRNFVGTYSEIGITDFIFYYPANEFYHSPKQDKMELFEHIARNVFPEFQKKYRPEAIPVLSRFA